MNQPRGRPFEHGNKAGRGRPKGSPNKPVDDQGQEMMGRYSRHLTGKLIEVAIKGNVPALRACMDRVSPARRGVLVRLPLGKIRTAQDVRNAAERVIRAVGRGQLTTGEAEQLLSLLERHSKIIERTEVEVRMEKLEQTMACGAQKYGAH